MKQENINQTLNGLIKNPRGSDREVSASIGLSQPTVTRHRSQLEKEGTIKFQAVPNFAKVGLKIMAISEIYLDTDEAEKAFLAMPEVLLATKTAENIMAVTVHNEYCDFVEFVNALKCQNIYAANTQVTDTASGMLKAFNTEKLVELLGDN